VGVTSGGFELDWVDEQRARQVRAVEGGPAKVGAGEVGAGEVLAIEPGADEHRAAQAARTQVELAQVRAEEVPARMLSARTWKPRANLTAYATKHPGGGVHHAGILRVLSPADVVEDALDLAAERG